MYIHILSPFNYPLLSSWQTLVCGAGVSVHSVDECRCAVIPVSDAHTVIKQTVRYLTRLLRKLVPLRHRL